MSAIRPILGSLALLSAAMSVFAAEVVAQEPPSGEPLFVEASVDDDRPYIGQQTAHLFRIYRRSDYSPPAGEMRYEPPSFAGFWNSEVSERREYSKTIGSQEYSVVELQTLLFPSIAGAIEIGPAKLSGPAGILESDFVFVDVRPLPTGAPPEFTGAVGRFEIAVEVNTTTIGAGEPAQVTVRISGEGNIEALPEPDWPEFQHWRLITAPSHADSRVSDGRLTGIRVYEVALAPRDAGQLTIPAMEYAYFDPELERYASSKTAPVIVTVVDTGESSVVQDGGGVGVVDQSRPEPRPIMTSPSSMNRAGRELTDLPVYWVAWLVPALFIVGALMWRRRQNALETARLESRQRNALANARAALARAVSSGDYPAVVAADSLLSYLSDRLGENLTGLTSDGVGLRIQSVGAPHDLADRVAGEIARGEEARFAPEEEHGVGTSSDIERAIQILTDLEEAIEG